MITADEIYGRYVRMKISGTGPLNQKSVRRQDRSRNAQGGGFASKLSEGPSSQASSAAPQVESLSSLLAAQEVGGDESGGRSAARERAELLLDKLDQLRHGLLAGRISGNQLSDLMRTVRDRRDQVADPRIREVLDQIELRAAVELAKIRRGS